MVKFIRGAKISMVVLVVILNQELHHAESIPTFSCLVHQKVKNMVIKMDGLLVLRLKYWTELGFD